MRRCFCHPPGSVENGQAGDPTFSHLTLLVGVGDGSLQRYELQYGNYSDGDLWAMDGSKITVIGRLDAETMTVFVDDVIFSADFQVGIPDPTFDYGLVVVQ